MEYFIFFILIIFLTFLANKKSFLPNYNGSGHQKFLNTQNIPLIGGFFILICLIKIYLNKDFSYVAFFILIFLTGFFSDSKLLSSPKLRLLLQILIVSIFVGYYEIHVTPTRIDLIDQFLQNDLFSLIFTIFCFIVLVNGSNFIDGLNGLLLGYFLIILLNLNLDNLYFNITFLEFELNFLFFSLIIILILNYLNFLFMGDGGSYLIALFFGHLLVSFYNSTSNISPYYIILLLWYPCFEILFSLIRKYFSNKSPMQPDNNHLHQLIFSYYQKKLKIKNKVAINITSSLSINSFNLIIIFLATKNSNLTILQLKLILIAISVYCIVYFILYRNLKLYLKK
jgi:UDP-N-acetylmuramyl pentapeptide phosphotransferase/UDP-N-acetylglucosamine-1-phosphate transferase